MAAPNCSDGKAHSTRDDRSIIRRLEAYARDMYAEKLRAA